MRLEKCLRLPKTQNGTHIHVIIRHKLFVFLKDRLLHLYSDAFLDFVAQIGNVTQLQEVNCWFIREFRQFWLFIPRAGFIDDT